MADKRKSRLILQVDDGICGQHGDVTIKNDNIGL